MAQKKAPENETSNEKFKRLAASRLEKRLRPAFRTLRSLTAEQYRVSEDDWKPIILEIRGLLGELEEAASARVDKCAILAELRSREEAFLKEREAKAKDNKNSDRWA